MKTLGERIRFLLIQNGISARQLARAIQLPETTLSNILNNRYEPGVERVRRIAEYLNADLHWLITGEKHDRSQSDPPEATSRFFQEFARLIQNLERPQRGLAMELLSSLFELLSGMKKPE